MWKTKIQSPVGELRVYANEKGLSGLLWPESDVDKFEANGVVESPDYPVFKKLTRQLEEYFAGSRQEFELPLDPQGTEFQMAAWEALRGIPFGETRTYGQQASSIGRPKAVRAIGAANGKNPISIVVPCHRVIGADSSLTGFGGGIEVKRFLLDHESKTRSTVKSRGTSFLDNE